MLPTKQRVVKNIWFWFLTLNTLKNAYPNDDVHVGVMFGTNEDHIYLTSLDGVIVYDIFASAN